MKDKELIKRILQEQELILPTANFTNQVMQRIVFREKRKKIFFQLLWFYCIGGVGIWSYLYIKPYLKGMITFVSQVWKIPWKLFFSWEYLLACTICISLIYWIRCKVYLKYNTVKNTP